MKLENPRQAETSRTELMQIVTSREALTLDLNLPPLNYRRRFGDVSKRLRSR